MIALFFVAVVVAVVVVACMRIFTAVVDFNFVLLTVWVSFPCSSCWACVTPGPMSCTASASVSVFHVQFVLGVCCSRTNELYH